MSGIRNDLPSDEKSKLCDKQNTLKHDTRFFKC